MTPRITTTRLLVLATLAALSGACDPAANEFKDAPVAKAPDTPAAKAALAVDAPKTNTPQGAELPKDHPVVGAPTKAGPLPTDKAPRPRVPVTGAAPNSYGTTGPLLWTAPETWTPAKPSSSMRLAEYVVPGPEGSEAGVVSIFFFPGGGGGVEANLARWEGQLETQDGKPVKAERKVRQINGLTVHSFDAAGNYNAGAAMMGGGEKADQRVLGAIVEISGGLFVFKLLGPSATISPNVDAFESLVKSFKPNA